MSNMTRKVLFVLVVLALGAAGLSLLQRVHVESRNRQVGIALDYNRVQELAMMRGVPTAEALRRLKDAGATHVAIREDSLTDLIGAEKVEVVPQSGRVLMLLRPDVRDRVMAQLKARMPGGKPLPTGDGMSYENEQAADSMKLIGMGYSEQSVRDAKIAGLKLVARPVAEMALTREAISGSLDAVQAIGADIVVFAGIQVYGMYDLIKWSAEELDRRQIRFGYVEMGKQFGDDRLSAALKGRILRTHAIAQAEMPKLSPQRALDRYRQAVRERNVRLCYFRPYDQGAEDPLQVACDDVRSMAADLRDAGYSVGDPHVYQEVSVSTALLVVMLIGTGAATILLLQLFFAIPAGLTWGLILLDVLLSLAGTFVARGMAQSLGALGAAIVFPTWAICRMQWREPGGRLSLGRALGAFVVMSLVSLAGGLLAAGCLSDLAHMMQIAAFRGVKFAQVIPLGVVLVVFVARSMRSYDEVRTEMGTNLPEAPALWAGIVEAATGVVRYWHVAIMVVALAAAALMLMRSGNVTPVPPSGLEMKARAVLDHTLGVRPRSKEILFGHPAMILALTFLLAGRRKYLWAAMVAGTVGQVSLVNSCGHIHTPLLLQLMRIGNGLWLGIVVAVALWVIGGIGVRWWSGRAART